MAESSRTRFTDLHPRLALTMVVLSCDFIQGKSNLWIYEIKVGTIDWTSSFELKLARLKKLLMAVSGKSWHDALSSLKPYCFFFLGGTPHAKLPHRCRCELTKIKAPSPPSLLEPITSRVSYPFILLVSFHSTDTFGALFHFKLHTNLVCPSLCL